MQPCRVLEQTQAAPRRFGPCQTIQLRTVQGTWWVLQAADLGTRSRQGPAFASREALLRDVVDRLLLIPALQVVVDEPGCVTEGQPDLTCNGKHKGYTRGTHSTRLLGIQNTVFLEILKIIGSASLMANLRTCTRYGSLRRHQ